MKDILKAFAILQGWGFEYGRRDFQNLFDQIEDKDKIYMFVDPIEEEDIDDESGFNDKISYSGSIFLLYSSDIDELTYEDRYETYIKPLLLTSVAEIKNNILCEHEGNIVQWKKIPVINVFDYNFDGILLSFKVNLDAD